MGVQTFASDLAVEGFDERIVCWLSRPAEVEDYTVGVSPEIEIARHKLAALVNADGLQIANFAEWRETVRARSNPSPALSGTLSREGRGTRDGGIVASGSRKGRGMIEGQGVEWRAGVLYVGSQGGRSSVVEHLLPKQNVVGSIPIARSKLLGTSWQQNSEPVVCADWRKS